MRPLNRFRMPALGEEFRSAREARGLSLSDVAERLHIRSVYLGGDRRRGLARRSARRSTSAASCEPTLDFWGSTPRRAVARFSQRRSRPGTPAAAARPAAAGGGGRETRRRADGPSLAAMLSIVVRRGAGPASSATSSSSTAPAAPARRRRSRARSPRPGPRPPPPRRPTAALRRDPPARDGRLAPRARAAPRPPIPRAGPARGEARPQRAADGDVVAAGRRSMVR